MRIRRAVALALAAALTLASCSDETQPTDPEPTWTPTGTPEEPSSSPAAATEPKLPAAATEATEEGARAFLAYYWKVVNYAQVSGDVSPLRDLSASSCSICSAFQKDLRKHYRSGGRIRGGKHTTDITGTRELTTPDGSTLAFRIDFVVSHDAQTIEAGDGTSDERQAVSERFIAYVHWVDSTRWRVDAMEIA